MNSRKEADQVNTVLQVQFLTPLNQNVMRESEVYIVRLPQNFFNVLHRYSIWLMKYCMHDFAQWIPAITRDYQWLPAISGDYQKKQTKNKITSGDFHFISLKILLRHHAPPSTSLSSMTVWSSCHASFHNPFLLTSPTHAYQSCIFCITTTVTLPPSLASYHTAWTVFSTTKATTLTTVTSVFSTAFSCAFIVVKRIVVVTRFPPRPNHRRQSSPSS